MFEGDYNLTHCTYAFLKISSTNDSLHTPALNKLAHHFSSAWEMLERAKLNRLLYCTLRVSNMFGCIMNIQEKEKNHSPF